MSINARGQNMELDHAAYLLLTHEHVETIPQALNIIKHETRGTHDAIDELVFEPDPID